MEWGELSAFVQVTSVPAATSTSIGSKAKSAMATAPSPAGVAAASPPPSSDPPPDEVETPR
jgi:hypothetical protein